MGGNRITTTVEALKLFLYSLPPESMFEIISYGTDYTTLSKGGEGFEYNDLTLKEVLKEISTFKANY